MNIYIDGLNVEVQDGQTILAAASAAGIRIPTLCYLRDVAPGGSCGICEVEVNGAPVRACVVKVQEGMQICTDSPELKARRKERLEALAQAHRFDCEFCPRCSDCEFIRLLNEHGIYDYEYSRTSNLSESKRIANMITLDITRCVGCRRCIAACPEKIISLQDGRAQVRNDACTSCGACVAACPTAAFTVDEKESFRAIRRALHDKSKVCAAIVCPDAGAVFGEMIFDPAGLDSFGKIAAVLRRLGFDKVYAATRQASAAQISEAFHKENESAVTVSISTGTGEKPLGTDIELTIYGLHILFRRACVSRHTLVKVWRELEAEEFDLIDTEKGEKVEYEFGGAMPHRDCYTRNLTDLSALRASVLEQICSQ